MLSLSPRAKALFLALGIFLLGAICGAMGERWFILRKIHPAHNMHSDGPPRPDRGNRGGPGPSIRRMAQDLNLTEEQQTAISKIITAYRTRLDSVRQEIGDKMRTSSEEIKEKIKAELTDEQREQFDQMEREREDRWRKGRGNRGGWGKGPPRGPRPGP